MRLSLFEPKPSQVFDTGPRSIAAVSMLRISVTDRCNFRCQYCMPAEGVAWLPKDELLTFEEIVDIAKAAVELHGIRRFKLTGGEPTLRRGITDLVRLLKNTRGVEDVSLTTNGFALPDLARPLRESGLDRVTISVDSLKADRFKAITRTGDLPTVLRGIDTAIEAGFASVKINCVTMRGTNDDELVDFARLTLAKPVTVRFIEYMPLGYSQFAGRVSDDEIGPTGGCGAQDRGDVFISETDVRQAIENSLGELQPVERSTEAGVGPAVPYQLPNALGRVAFISAMSAPFCSTCNRLRLTATGVLRSCLFEGGEVDLKPILRGQSADRRRAVADAMVECVRLKPDVHSHHGNEQMSRIGG
ncbi:MAG: GTP 3',8-cyclase MoaA [Tepidisphaeraceae bacterium]